MLTSKERDKKIDSALSSLDKLADIVKAKAAPADINEDVKQILKQVEELNIVNKLYTAKPKKKKLSKKEIEAKEIAELRERRHQRLLNGSSSSGV